MADVRDTTKVPRTEDADENQEVTNNDELKSILLAENGDDDRRAHVNKYSNPATYQYEEGEVVWVVEPGFRAPADELIIVKAHPNDLFELKYRNGDPYRKLVKRQHLRRDPYGI